MASAWSLTPYVAGAPKYGAATGGFTGIPLTGGAAPSTSSYSIPFTNTGKTYSSAGTTFSPQPAAPKPSYGASTISALGGISGGGAGQPSTASQPQPQRNPYSQPSTAAPGGSAAPTGSAPRSGALTQPGAYENWYRDNASRYSQPTTQSSYWQSVQGKFGGQRFQPTNATSAYGQVQDMFGRPSQGITNARDVSSELRNTSQGENVMGQAAGMLGGPVLTSQYYRENAPFFSTQGDVENYYDNNASRFQNTGFGEQYAQDILSNPALDDMFYDRPVGDEFGFYQQPLRDKSYSEQLYESGNDGLNTYYSRENDKAQKALSDRMAAMGIFGSGETVAGMAEIDSELAAQQARDMAGLAGQADDQRLGRAGLAMDFSRAAGDEGLARSGLMLDAAGAGMQLDRDAIARLVAGGNLANMSSTYALDRIMGGGNLARSADDATTSRGAALGNVGNDLASQYRERMGLSASTGLNADAEERYRTNDMFDAAARTDSLGLDADRNALDWVVAGGNMAGNVDQSNLDWLNSGGGAAQTAQSMFQERERYGFTDPLAAGSAMAGTYQSGAANNTAASAADRTEAINLLMHQEGLDATTAERRANEWMQLGTFAVQLAALRNKPPGGA